VRVAESIVNLHFCRCECFKAWWKIANKSLGLFVDNVEKDWCVGFISETNVTFCCCTNPSVVAATYTQLCLPDLGLHIAVIYISKNTVVAEN
jgi:hypothetical protein